MNQKSIWKSVKSETASNGSLVKDSALRAFKACLAALAMMGLVMVFGSNKAAAQDRIQLTGTVTDAGTGEPIPGVNIRVKGTTSGAITDPSGKYSFSAPSDAQILVFSFVGYITVEEPINGRTTIDVALNSDVQLLDDVVVVGYGVQEKQEITSSVATVSAEDFNQGNVQDGQQLIQGKVAGLNIVQPGGDPNGNYEIRLRGISTFGANSEPLVVVDGVVGADFNSVDPNDIESINVLKDASAAAIYGTRGSNGVIIITTKSGSSTLAGGKSVQVSYSGQGTLTQVANRLDVLNADEFRSFTNDLPGSTDGVNPRDLGADTDWFDEVSNDAFTQVHSLSISGGNETTQYRVSGNLRDEDGIQKGTGSEQILGRLNLSHKAFRDRLKISTILSITDRQEEIGFGEVFRYASIFNPTAPIRNESDPRFGGFNEFDQFDLFNPVAINELTTNSREVRRFTGRLAFDYEFVDWAPGLIASASYSVESENIFAGQEFSKFARFRGFGRNGLANRTTTDAKDELWETTLAYTTQFDKINLNGIAGYSFQQFDTEGQFAEGGDFTSDVFGFNNLAAAQDFANGLGTVTSFKNKSRLIAGFVRVQADYDKTYFLTGTYRREGSSRFGSNERWGDFFAATGGVEVTRLVSVPYVESLKLRVSYGETGNNAPFDGISQLQFGPNGFFLRDGAFSPTFGPASNPNPDLKWEVKKEVNFGADFDLLEGRVTGSVDVFFSTTEDLILETNVPVPPNVFPTTFQNVGEIDNNGIEVLLSGDVIRQKDWNWNTTFTFATFNSELTKFNVPVQIRNNVGAPGLNDTPLVRVAEGEDLGQIWGVVFDGFGPNGEWQFVDQNNDGVIDQQDRRVIGNGLPDFTLGWQNVVRYGDWDLNMFWRGAFGHDLVNTFRIFNENPVVISERNVLDSSIGETGALRESPQFSSFHVESADFFRLDNITLGYNVPLPDNFDISRLRFYISGNNLITITGYDGIDPEVRFSDTGAVDNGGVPGTPDPLSPGIERRNQWFTARSFTVGVNIDF